MTRLNRIVSLVLIFIMMMTLLSGCAALNVFSQGGGLVINEVVSANESSFPVEGLGAPDWLELYNGSDKEIDLTGYTILRTDTNDKQFEIPSGTIAPGEYLVICATEAVAEDCAYLITGFNLPKKGVGLKLKDANGMTVDQFNVPTMAEDISYCRTAEGMSFCQTPTPGSENAGVFAATLEEVEAAEAPVAKRGAARATSSKAASTRRGIRIRFTCISSFLSIRGPKHRLFLSSRRFPFCFSQRMCKWYHIKENFAMLSISLCFPILPALFVLFFPPFFRPF